MRIEDRIIITLTEIYHSSGKLDDSTVTKTCLEAGLSLIHTEYIKNRLINNGITITNVSKSIDNTFQKPNMSIEDRIVIKLTEIYRSSGKLDDSTVTKACKESGLSLIHTEYIKSRLLNNGIKITNGSKSIDNTFQKSNTIIEARIIITLTESYCSSGKLDNSTVTKACIEAGLPLAYAEYIKNRLIKNGIKITNISRNSDNAFQKNNKKETRSQAHENHTPTFLERKSKTINNQNKTDRIPNIPTVSKEDDKRSPFEKIRFNFFPESYDINDEASKHSKHRTPNNLNNIIPLIDPDDYYHLIPQDCAIFNSEDTDAYSIPDIALFNSEYIDTYNIASIPFIDSLIIESQSKSMSSDNNMIKNLYFNSKYGETTSRKNLILVLLDIPFHYALSYSLQFDTSFQDTFSDAIIMLIEYIDSYTPKKRFDLRKDLKKYFASALDNSINHFSPDNPLISEKHLSFDQLLEHEVELHKDSFDMSEEEVHLCNKLNYECILNELRSLTPVQQLVIIMRSGLIDGEYRTLEQVGKVIGKTRERVRQIEKEAQKRLRYRVRKALKVIN